MVRKSIRLKPSLIVRRASLAGIMVIATVPAPSWAQYQQPHHSSAGSKGKAVQQTQHLSPALSQSQMSAMLDEVSGGKSPTLPPQSQRKPQPQSNGMSGMLPAMSNIVRPQAGGLLRGGGMGQNMGNMGMHRGMGMTHGMGMSNALGTAHGMGMARGLGMGAMGHGMMPMGTMGGGAGMGMQHSGMTGGGAANFMQQFKQKFGALMPAAGAGGEENGEEGGESGGGGMPMMPGGMPGGGGGMQAQLMQKLFQGQAPGGAAPAGGGMPGGLGALMGGMGGGMGHMGGMPAGGMPIARPSARGSGMGMPSMQQAQSHNNQNDVIKRPPGMSGIAGGASSPPRGASSSSISDLERQMEQQYGR
ncbi:MAG: hypothetical protein JST89_23450 [Cyanobacteria bacterium SZAS-4]|nr:hypothetical protein [Cyanobacteria bacterium SZAS-4]